MTTIIIILALTCTVLFITVLLLFYKNENLLERLVAYKSREYQQKENVRPLYNLYIDKKLVLRDCTHWSLDDSGTLRKLSVKSNDSSLTLYTHGSEFHFVKSEKDTYKDEQSVEETA